MPTDEPPPTEPEASRLFGEGVRCLEAGDTENAQRRFMDALLADPLLAEARFNLALLAARRGDFDAALSLLRDCCRQRPAMAEAHAALGAILLRAGDPSGAQPALRHALALEPGRPTVLNNLGLCLLATDRLEEAESVFRSALEAAPGHPDISSNLGSVLHDQGRNSAAAELLSGLLSRHPGHDKARLNLAFALLSAGRYTDAWPHFEARKRLQLVGSGRSFPGRAWEGREELRGRTILIHSEQGLGDTLQFSRFIPALLDRGAKVHLELQAPLLPLFASLPGIEALYEAGKPLPVCDFYCALPSLPHAFATTPGSLPQPNPGLSVDAELSASWAGRLAGGSHRLRVGLVWSGSPLHPNDRRRSLPLQALANALRGLPLQFVSLQLGATPSELELLGRAGPLLNLAPQIRHFADSAAILQNLDLLVSVDTAWAHLAGLLGRPLWLALATPADWRWSADLEGPGWYPSARVFRQSAPGAWDSVLAPLCQALRERASQG